MTAEEFREKMLEDNWTEKEINEILELREKARKAGINPPALETFIIGAIYTNESVQREDSSCYCVFQEQSMIPL